LLYKPLLTSAHRRQHADYLKNRRHIDAGAMRLRVGSALPARPKPLSKTEKEGIIAALSTLMQPVFALLLGAPQRRTRMKWDEIKRVVAAFYKLTPVEILARERTYRISHPRFVCMYLAKKFAGYSYGEIGRLIHTDHSVPLYGARYVALRIGDTSISQPKGVRPLPPERLDKKLCEEIAHLEKALGV